MDPQTNTYIACQLQGLTWVSPRHNSEAGSIFPTL